MYSNGDMRLRKDGEFEVYRDGDWMFLDTKKAYRNLLRVARAARIVIVNIPHGQSLSPQEELEANELSEALEEVKDIL